MLRNLYAEQARTGLLDKDLAKKLGISRAGFLKKKKNMSFRLKEIHILLEIFNCDFMYLFEMDNDVNNATYTTNQF